MWFLLSRSKNKIIGSLFFVITLLACTHVPLQNSPLNKHNVLTVSVICKNDKCQYDGSNSFPMKIRITNTSQSSVDVPLSFIEQRGPTINLKDNNTNQDFDLRGTPPDPSLLSNKIRIPPNGSVSFDVVLSDDTLNRFNTSPLDLLVTVGISAPITVDGETINYYGKASINIKTKHK